MLGITFICGSPCNPSQVAALKKRGYEVEDVAELLMSTKFGDKLFQMKDGTTVIV